MNWVLKVSRSPQGQEEREGIAFQAEGTVYTKAQKVAYMEKSGFPVNGAWFAWWGVTQQASEDQPVCQIEILGYYLRTDNEKLLSADIL